MTCLYLYRTDCRRATQRNDTCDKEQTIFTSTSEGKAGKSYKLCPGCFKQVSRNATSCPHCTSTCSKTFRTSKKANISKR